MTASGRGYADALAFVLIIWNAERFPCGKQVASYQGLVPLEKSSENRRRLGHITKQGSSLVRFLLVEAAQDRGSVLARTEGMPFAPVCPGDRAVS